MRVLIACEYSGVVRDAFTRYGHDAWSCDILPTESEGPHFQQDMFTSRGEWAIPGEWDLIICHPPCTRLAVSGAWAVNTDEKRREQRQSMWFFMQCVGAPALRVAVENPVGIMSTHYRKPDQIIQPYNFGHDASKATCLWLKGLPLLKPTSYVEPRMVGKFKRWANQTDSGQNRLTPSPTRGKDRAKTYAGIAEAMASQWGT